MDLSNALLTKSVAGVAPLSAETIGRILSFMLWSGLACIEQTKTSDIQPLRDVSDIMYTLDNCKTHTELRHLFNDVSICLTTPLFYTRLGSDLLQEMNFDSKYLYEGYLFGKMLEVYMRGTASLLSDNAILTSVKLKRLGDPQQEVDIYSAQAGLMLEGTCSDKPGSGVNLQEHFQDVELIRVCTSSTHNEPIKCYHRVPYAQACCELDTGDMLRRKKTKANDIL
jgi:hypothetical protein